MNNSELIWRLEEELDRLNKDKPEHLSDSYNKWCKRRVYVANRISYLEQENSKALSKKQCLSQTQYVPPKPKPKTVSKPRRKVSKRITYKFKQPAPITNKRYHPKLDSDLHKQYRVDDNYAVSSNVAPAHSLFMSELVMWEENLLSYEEYLLSEYFDDFDDGRQSWERKWEAPVYTDNNQRHNYEEREVRAVAKMLDLCDYPLYT